MSKYLVETFYTCTFKIVHKLDELNEKKLAELENRKDGEVQIIDVRLNNRKTKTSDKYDKYIFKNDGHGNLIQQDGKAYEHLNFKKKYRLFKTNSI